MDRIDLHVHVNALDYDAIAQNTMQNHTSSEDLYTTVLAANKIQKNRFKNENKYNSMMNSSDVDQFCDLTKEAQETMKKAFERLRMSMRGYHKVIKVARTIADLAGSEVIDVAHIQEAVMYRSLDKQLHHAE